jgi:hypothetical protein
MRTIVLFITTVVAGVSYMGLESTWQQVHAPKTANLLTAALSVPSGRIVNRCRDQSPLAVRADGGLLRAQYVAAHL